MSENENTATIIVLLIGLAAWLLGLFGGLVRRPGGEEPQPEPSPDPGPGDDPVTDPRTDPLPDPETEPQPEPDPTSDPIGEPTEEPEEQPTEQPNEEPTEDTDDGPAEEPTNEPTEEPDNEPTPTPDPRPEPQPIGRGSSNPPDVHGPHQPPELPEDPTEPGAGDRDRQEQPDTPPTAPDSEDFPSEEEEPDTTSEPDTTIQTDDSKQQDPRTGETTKEEDELRAIEANSLAEMDRWKRQNPNKDFWEVRERQKAQSATSPEGAVSPGPNAGESGPIDSGDSATNPEDVDTSQSESTATVQQRDPRTDQTGTAGPSAGPTPGANQPQEQTLAEEMREADTRYEAETGEEQADVGTNEDAEDAEESDPTVEVSPEQAAGAVATGALVGSAAYFSPGTRGSADPRVQ